MDPHDHEADTATLEREALGRIVHAFSEYKHTADLDLMIKGRDFSRLKQAHKDLLPHFHAHLRQASQGVQHNHIFLRSMLTQLLEEGPDSSPFLPGALSAAEEYAAGVNGRVLPQDVEKVRYVLKNLMRDWSEEGAAERAASYGRIMQEVQSIASRQAPGQVPLSILVPGAGLGRLCANLCSMGHHVLGNEFSFYMLLASAYVLNHSARLHQWTVHPWLHSGCNHFTSASQLRGLAIPDVLPEDLTAPGELGMVAGDFVEVFARPEYQAAFDVVATCFFIDTAHNVIDYLETIVAVLKPGGSWVNLGPLLYHWAEPQEGPDEPNIELSLEEIEAVAGRLGLVMQRKDVVKAPFASNRQSMFESTYTCSFWTMTKGPGS
ncbi:hypothetical protein ACKKBF_B34410 [Auxenochlorella protothecoides x Auxenochlorella symbiontica]